MKNKTLMKVLSAFLAVAIVLCSAPLSGFVGIELFDIFNLKAWAAETEGICGDDLTWYFDESTGELIISGTGDMSETCSEEDAPWYQFENSITAVTIADGVTSICADAFSTSSLENYPSLSSVYIPGSVKSIGDNAFNNCESLADLTISDGVETIGIGSFSSCGSLTEIIIPESVTSLGDNAFSETGLVEITIPGNVKSIGEYAFEGCFDLQAATVEYGVENIGLAAFYQCEALEEVTIADSVTDIGAEAFNFCSSLSKVKLPNGLTTIAYCMFWQCFSLTEIVIPDSVKTIEYMAFSDTGLTDVIIPYGVTEIGDAAFYTWEPLNITIPDSVTTIGEGDGGDFCEGSVIYCTPGSYAETYAIEFGYEYFPLAVVGDGAGTVLVTFDFSEEANPYKGLILQFTGLTDGKIYTAFVDGYKTSTARRLDETQAYSLCLVSNRGVVFGTVDKIEFGENNIATVTFDNLLQRMDAELTVKDPDGKTIETGYNVQWAFTSDGDWKHTGNTVKDVTVGTCLTYKVTLSDALAKKYSQPEVTSVTVDESGNFTCKLSALPTVDISGEVKSDEGKALAVNIVITQHFENEISSSVTVKSDADGAFSSTVADVPLTVTVKKIGYKDFVWNGSASEIPEITLEKLTGDTVTLAVFENQLESDMSLRVDSAENLSFTVKADGKSVADFTVQYPSLIIPGGILSEGTKLSVTVTDNSGEFISSTEEIEFVVDGSNTMEISLVPKGKVVADVSSSGSEENMMMVFDNNGKKIETVTMSGMSAQSTHLKAGNYTVVIIEKTSILAAVPSLSKFNEYGLTSGTDYFSQKVTVENGKITEINGITVPDFDESKIYYTDKKQTYMNAGSPSVTLGEFLMVTVSFGFDEQTSAKVSDNVVSITLPENCNVITNGVSVNDITITDYTLSNQVLSIPVNEKSGTVKVMIRPVRMSDTGYYYFASALDFSLSGTDVVQPIGTLRVEAVNMKFNVPSKTTNNKLTALGKTVPRSKVEIYADGMLVATGETNLAGSFAIPFELSNPCNYCSYPVYCKVTTIDGDVFESPAEIITYDVTAIQASKVTMLARNSSVVFDFLNPSSKRQSYTVGLGEFSATFKVEFTENDPDRVRDVYVITIDGSGTETYVPVTYSKETGCWLGTYKYDATTAPRGVTVSFAGDTDYPDSIPVEFAEEAAEVYISYIEDLTEALDTVCEVGEGEFIDGSFVLETTIEGEIFSKTVITDIGYENFDISEWSGKNYLKYEVDGGNVYQLCETTDDKMINYIADDEGSYFKVENEIFPKPEEGSDGTPSTPGQGSGSDGTPSTPGQGGSSGDFTMADLATFLPSWAGPLAEAINNFGDVWNRSRELKGNVGILNGELGALGEVMLGSCKNGKPKIPPEEAAGLWDKYQKLNDAIEAYKDACVGNIQLEGAKNAVMGYALNKILPKAERKLSDQAVGAIHKKYSGIVKSMNKIKTGAGQGRLSSKNLANIKGATGYTVHLAEEALGDFDGLYAGNILGMMLEGAEKGIDPIESGYQGLHGQIEDLKGDIMEAANKCPPSNPKPQMPQMTVTPIIDPSGFVCEAVLSNRLEGVTVTCYYSPNEDGSDAVIWDAENYGQSNPLLTDENGYYEWFVPEGWWQVCYEKDGYQVGYSEWLPVPPPQTEVHYSMISLDSPQVECINAYSDCVEVRFTQYMDISSVTDSGMIITSNGSVLQGTWIPVNAEESLNDSSVEYASVFRFVPDGNESLSGSVTAEIENVENYAGKSIEEKHTETVSVVLRPESISAGANISLKFNESEEIEIAITSPEAGAGKTVLITSLNDSIVSVSASEVVADNNGKVFVTVSGLLPGETTIEYSIKGTDISGSTTVTVENVTETVATVHSTIESGSTVERGTTVSFYCETPDAEIYYTTDLSCPCVIDNPARTRYTGPITLTEDVIFIFYAVKDGMLDSQTKGFSYTVAEPEGVKGSLVGSVKSFLSETDAITLELVKSGETVASHAMTVTGDSAEFSFEGIEKGEYILKISKKNHVNREYNVTIGEDKSEIDVQLNLLGDINGDGKVNTIDVARANAQARSVSVLSGYEFACADINGDGKVNTIDVARMNAHARSVSTLW